MIEHGTQIFHSRAASKVLPHGMWKEVFELATPICMDRGACPVPGEAKDSMPAVSHEFVAAGWWYTYTSEKYESQLG